MTSFHPPKSLKSTYAVIFLLLASLTLDPLILPVDDGDLIKLILGRLTTRATFPNVILHGKSLGGSDDVQLLHDEGKLKQIFEKGDVHVMGDVKVAEG
jgi:glutaredoxin-related protein